MVRRLPLIYFHGVAPGKYLAAWPVFVVSDDPPALTFAIAVDDASHMGMSPLTPSVRDEGADIARRVYVTGVVRMRLHQRSFRERVLDAYHRQCAFCRLRHEELLDAAHIVPDPRDPVSAVPGAADCLTH